MIAILSIVCLATVATAAFSGVATFNDFATQTTTVCGEFKGTSGTFGAAPGDISPNVWEGATCSGRINFSQCSGQLPAAGVVGPACPTTNCGKCFKVTNEGGFGGAEIGGVGNSIIVQVIDACPSESAFNFCKTDVPPQERCGSSSTNSLDIDQSAYLPLTGEAFGKGPNLQISITAATCPLKRERNKISEAKSPYLSRSGINRL